MKQFGLNSLTDLDGGKAALAFEQHVRRAALDCMDRPGDPAARTVTLTVALTPVMEPGGDCTEVNAQIMASSAVPKHKTKPYSFGLRRNGVLVFAEDSLDNVNQGTLLGNDDE